MQEPVRQRLWASVAQWLPATAKRKHPETATLQPRRQRRAGTTIRPLELYEVLEDEHWNLHGPGPDYDDITLPGTAMGTTRPVRVKRDSWFHAGHIKSPLGFVDKLLESENGAAAPLWRFV